MGVDDIQYIWPSTLKISNLNIYFHPCSTKFLDGGQYFEGKINTLGDTISINLK